MRYKLPALFLDDSTARYRHTFVRLTDPEHGCNNRLAYVGEAGRNMFHFSMSNREALTFERGQKAAKDVEIETLMPQMQWMEHPKAKDPILLVRQPARQWKRSLSSSTHQSIRASNYTMEGRASNGIIHLNQINELEDVLDTPFKLDLKRQLEELLADERKGIVLSENLCLLHNRNILAGTTIIGRFFPKTESYRTHPLFSEELNDIFLGTGYKEVKKDEPLYLG